MSKFNIVRYEIDHPITIPHSTQTFIGIDPGSVNLGIAIATSYSAYLFQISIERNADAVERIKTAQKIWHSLEFPLPYGFSAVVEGAAFGESYRQVELAEVRTAIAIEMMLSNATVKFVSPMTIRKKVFGFAKIKAHEHWLKLFDKNTFLTIQQPDALAALSCAYYGLLTDMEK